MPVFISMLRGINLGGHKGITMASLRASFEAIGFREVRTYIQSGNVVFSAARSSASTLSKQIEMRLVEDFGFEVPVISRTSAEMGKVIQNNPFLKEAGIDLSKLHVTFMTQPPAAAALVKLDKWTTKADQFRCGGAEIYLHCANGYGQTKLNNNALEKALATGATTRNWNTVNKLYEMSVQGR